MTNLDFIGIVESTQNGLTTYKYCLLDQQNNQTTNFSDLEFLGMYVGSVFGKNFKEKTTYIPPAPDTQHEPLFNITFTLEYHPLSPAEKESLEMTVYQSSGAQIN